MNKIPSILIYDFGKTNKKQLLFDESYNVIYEQSQQTPEIQDEDGCACEDILALTEWVKSSLTTLLNDNRFEIKAVNFSAYGASWVYLNDQLEVIPPMYNYLKPLASKIKKQFYNSYGGENQFSKITASPVLGNLNSGMQLYRLKYERPEVFKEIKYALHLPQYLSFIVTSALNTDITSIGCHTNLWNFKKNRYHLWVKKEGVEKKLPSIMNSDVIASYSKENIPAGIGLHDSSAALIPYLISFTEPFVLISTGTWCITLNPFNHSTLSDYELQNDCLSYLSFDGSPVKASRLFTGYEHEKQIKKFSEYFHKPLDYYKTVQYNFLYVEKKNNTKNKLKKESMNIKGAESIFCSKDLKDFASYEEAYHKLIANLIEQQIESTNLVLKRKQVKRIFVDGGFANNSIFMNLLAEAYSEIEVYAASFPYASALGAALVIHKHWNTKPLPTGIIQLTLYTGRRNYITKKS